jgi:hypothetical protein
MGISFSASETLQSLRHNPSCHEDGSNDVQFRTALPTAPLPARATFAPRKTKQNEDVFPCEQITILVSLIMLPAEEVRRDNHLPLTSDEKHMETILIVLLVVFLLGGGGWGYTRWRGN